VRSLKLMILLGCIVLVTGCAATHREIKVMETTGYDGCGQCCGWERGNWAYMKLDFWNRYITAGKSAGKPYTGQTASGTYPHIPHPGLFSVDSLENPWMIPVRIVFFPWLFLPSSGTIAADTKYYPFGTEMYVPGWGWGIVEDRGSAIKGPTRLDLYFYTHGEAGEWGRKKVKVDIRR
jgi:hypothetical protein